MCKSRVDDMCALRVCMLLILLNQDECQEIRRSVLEDVKKIYERLDAPMTANVRSRKLLVLSQDEKDQGLPLNKEELYMKVVSKSVLFPSPQLCLHQT